MSTDTTQSISDLLASEAVRPDRPGSKRLVPVGVPASGSDGLETEAGAVEVNIFCPTCSTPHVDEGEWATRRHKTHQCQSCGHEWRPFPFATVGVAHPTPADPEAGAVAWDWRYVEFDGTRTKHLTRYDPRDSSKHDQSWVADVQPLYAHPTPAAVEALKPLVRIADAYDNNALDAEARKTWGPQGEHTNTTPPEEIELYTGRGGKRLLTLADCLAAREAFALLSGEDA